MKALAKMEELAPLRAAAEFSFEFREPANAPNPLLVMEDVNAGYKIGDGFNGPVVEKTVVSGINFSLQIGQRIGLLGVNGAGKSTLIKTIAGELAPLSGDSRFGKGLAIGYFAQHQVEMLRARRVAAVASGAYRADRARAGIAQLPRQLQFQRQHGHQQDRAVLRRRKGAAGAGADRLAAPNLLLLDEPTNHLDLETREALTMALAQFEGTLVLVSHDRHLLRATTDQFIIVADGKLQPFDGDLDDYRDWLFKTKLAAKTAAGTAPAALPPATANPPASWPLPPLSTSATRSDSMPKSGKNWRPARSR